MANKKATTTSSSNPNTSRKEVIGRKNYLTFGVKRVAQTFIDSTHQLITGESLGSVSMVLDSTKAQLKEALAKIESLHQEQEEKEERNRMVIASLTRRQKKADAEIIWQKDVAQRTARSLRAAEEANAVQVSHLSRCLVESNLRFTEAEGDKASLQKSVDSLQVQLKESATRYHELSESEAQGQLDLQRSRLEAEKHFREVQALKWDVIVLREENHLLRWKWEDSESARKANEVLVESLWSEVYNPPTNSLAVTQLENAESTIEVLSATLEAKEAVIDSLSFELALTTPLPQVLDEISLEIADEGKPTVAGEDEAMTIAKLETSIAGLQEAAKIMEQESLEKDSMLFQSSERILALESQNEDLSRQIASEREAVVELHAEVQDLVACLKSENDELALQIVAERAAVAELGAQVEDQAHKLEQFESETDELQSDVADLCNDNRTLGDDLSLAERRILLLQLDCNKAAKDRQYMVSLYEDRETELSEQVEWLKREMSQSQDAAAETKSGVEENVRCGKVEVLRSTAKISQLERQKEGLETEVTRLEGIAKDGGEKLEECDSVVNKLKIELLALRSATNLREVGTVSVSPSFHTADEIIPTPSETANVLPTCPAAGHPIRTYTSKDRQHNPRPSSSGGHSWVELSGHGQRSSSGPSRYREQEGPGGPGGY